ncbi:DUF4279 domain-containing protein [Xanthomonas citri pv. fuscans CFBP 6996]|uniref:DUF4279 domain-containing protein n=1 Tax=Xanthomonas citri TaxID=346 RepID=UPI000B5C9438|nr:DUF4279 domain-containing protein [Xanthomonas citri]MBV6839236.1 DUF4279 domain-containing protein [Xanthomonas campestris pv. merremiae]ASK94942.1 hypothetical protein XcvCFBP7112P_00185 [Xanthomonas citri pv. vignicola]ATS49873.1 DUF4279 domain-containing protein [Xanthomonas citri pv. phaseoli var. fuscans]ATS55605.1 DUF4279 domain-containing protein [Xanthomonas citri pv. phaseoli var. fuscans]ATS60380.1 DUF4279 domain-containing protein [Xanthomonas citri pv. phaseoli var. fuscans]
MTEEEMPSCRHKLSLRLRHPSARLDSCTKQFGMEPLRQWSFGEPRTSNREVPLPGVWQNSYWTAQLDSIEDESLEQTLERILCRLEEHVTYLDRHRQSGGSVEVYIGFFLEGCNAGFCLTPELLSRSSKLGIAFSVDVYAP